MLSVCEGGTCTYLQQIRKSLRPSLTEFSAVWAYNPWWRAWSRVAAMAAMSAGEEALSGRYVAFSRQKEVDRRTAGVHSPV